MNQIERLIYLVTYLINEHNYIIEIPQSHDDLFQLYRTLVNIREAKDISDEFLTIQDEMLKIEIRKKGIVSIDSKQQLVVWKGDITRLKVDAIVNAANNQMEGCFIPGHHCIDNAIHTYAGIQLRNTCHQLMISQGFKEPTGNVKITLAYNLPSRYILHTVGPSIKTVVTKKDELLLESCYKNCLNLAYQHNVKTIAFCCISTGVFCFPKNRAAKIAIETVKKYLADTKIKQVIFNVFDDEDESIYQQLLNQNK